MVVAPMKMTVHEDIKSADPLLLRVRRFILSCISQLPAKFIAPCKRWRFCSRAVHRCTLFSQVIFDSAEDLRPLPLKLEKSLWCPDLPQHRKLIKLLLI